jgi:hypothetical protein
MERYKSQLVRFFALVGMMGFSFANPSYAQSTPGQEAKINAAADSIARAAANLPPHEKKIASFILQRINRMIQEQAKSHPSPEKKVLNQGVSR